jgi:hypothetical protein
LDYPVRMRFAVLNQIRRSQRIRLSKLSPFDGHHLTLFGANTSWFILPSPRNFSYYRLLDPML